jgi:SAM-dependent methyltransferase
MHASVAGWVADTVAIDGLASLSTLEVGSLDVNGSVRGSFKGPYVGVDMRDGPGVDQVANAHALPFDDASFELVVSTETLEHDAAFWLSLAEMGRVLADGGHLLLTTRGVACSIHDFPADYWRFTPDSGPLLAELAGCDIAEQEPDPELPGLFLHGVRRGR